MTALLDRVLSVLLTQPGDAAAVVESGAVSGGLARPAAVLFPIVLHPGAPSVLFTQRMAHLKAHPGQVSFPGGQVEATDRSPADTALRETEEEIGLARRHIEVVGYLPSYLTGTGFSVIPVVGLIRPPFAVHPDPSEVAEVFEVPLDFLLDDAHHQRMALHVGGRRRAFYSMPYGDRFIWGATAGMIRSLHDRLTA